MDTKKEATKKLPYDVPVSIAEQFKIHTYRNKGGDLPPTKLSEVN